MLYASFICAILAFGVAGVRGVIASACRGDRRHRGNMFRIRWVGPISALIFCAGLAGCRGTTQLGSQGGNNGNSSVVLAMTDTPPSNVSILSAEVTLTGAA